MDQITTQESSLILDTARKFLEKEIYPYEETVDKIGEVPIELGKQIEEKAKEAGVGIATLNNAGHLGAAGFHAKMAVDEDMIGVCMSGGGGFAMLPTYGAEPRLSLIHI